MAKPLHILFLSANPEGTTKLKLVEEYKQIDAKIQASEFREQFELEQSHAVSLMELQHLLLRFKPNIVHFSGHGSENGALVFDSDLGSLATLLAYVDHTILFLLQDGGPGFCSVHRWPLPR